MKSETGWLDNPIFVCGHQRAGTTLLISLLDGHSKLMVLPEEIQLFTQVYPSSYPKPAFMKRFGGILLSAKTGQPLESLKGMRDYTHLDSTILEGRLEKLVTQAETWPELLKAGAEAYFEANPDLRSRGSELRYWVEKTPGQEHFASTLSNWFNRKAIFVYIFRDPRDTFISYRILHPDLTVRAFAGRWQKSIATAWLLRLTNSKFFMVRYESMLNNPRQEISKLLERLGLEFEAKCMIPTLGGNVWKSSKDFDGISTNTIGGYLRDLSSRECSELENLLFIPMRIANYRCITRRTPTRSAIIRFTNLLRQVAISTWQRKQKKIR